MANTSNKTVQYVQITASIYDPSHTTIGTGSAYTDVDTLGPGERSAFGLISNDLSKVAPIGTYQLSISSQPAFGREKPAFLRLTIGRSYLDSINTYHVIGEVTNQGDSTANFVKVSGAFYDYDHQVIGHGISYVTTFSNGLPPGQTAPFDMMIESSPNQQVVSASYNVQSQEYSMINNQAPNIPPRSSSSSNMMQLQQPSVITNAQTSSASSATANVQRNKVFTTNSKYSRQLQKR